MSASREVRGLGRSRGLATLVLGLAGGLGGCSGASERGTSVLLVTLDTTRADALACYGGRQGLTPHLDRLAQEGVRFSNAHTVAPLTLPAHASMLTGLYPLRHGVRDNGLAAVPASAETLAEVARGAGVQTAAFVAAVVLDETFGLEQGFDVYGSPARSREKRGSHFTELPGEQVVDEALAWMARRDRSRRFFLWVHLFDPHGPYEPALHYRQRAMGDAYLGEVAATDAAVGRLVDSLREQGDLADTLVCVVADHGEAFGEHSEYVHGPYVYESTLRVPLILRYPDSFEVPAASELARGQVSDAVVSVVDVHPTLLEALGLPAAPGLDGVSLLRGAPPAERGVYFESYSGYLSHGWSPLAGILDAEGKYIHSSKPQLFVLSEDPDELDDRIEEDPARAQRYRATLAELQERPRLEVDAPAGIDASMLEVIRSLGYASGGGTTGELPDPLDPSDRPSPAEMVEEAVENRRAIELQAAGKHAEVEAVYRRIVARNPRNYFALDRLATALMDQDRLEEAIEPLEKLLHEGPQWAGSYFNLGVCLQRAGRQDEALGAFRRAVELQPREPIFVDGLAAALRAAGRDEEARELELRLGAGD